MEAAEFVSAKNDLNADREQVPASVEQRMRGKCAPRLQPAPRARDSTTRENARVIGVLLGIVGAGAVTGGLVLLLTDHPADKTKDSADTKTGRRNEGPRLHVVPRAGLHGGGVDLALSF